jgi:uncharacterized protein (TIGR04168 family)
LGLRDECPRNGRADEKAEIKIFVKPEHPVKIAIVGDVHNLWETADAIALHHLGVDLVLFVGDFGNEDIEIVDRIASLDLPKAAIFGNHDAWYTASDWGRSKCPYDRDREDRVQEQIDLLGASYVGYGKLDFPQFNLSIVGARPFSWGGSVWKYHSFHQERFGVDGFESSTAKIVAAGMDAKSDRLIIIGHNGPTGLGEEPEAICGKDWGEPMLGGDYGDPDLAAAISQLRTMGKSIPLVAFGHMHHKLRHRKDRLRQAHTIGPEGIFYLNAARCPRILSTVERTVRNFSIVTIDAAGIIQAGLVWTTENHQIGHEEIYWHRDYGTF